MMGKGGNGDFLLGIGFVIASPNFAPHPEDAIATPNDGEDG